MKTWLQRLETCKCLFATVRLHWPLLLHLKEIVYQTYKDKICHIFPSIGEDASGARGTTKHGSDKRMEEVVGVSDK